MDGLWPTGRWGGGTTPDASCRFFTLCFYERDIQKAITAPRWLLGKEWGDETTNLKMESRFESTLIEQMVGAGHEVEIVGPRMKTIWDTPGP